MSQVQRVMVSCICDDNLRDDMQGLNLSNVNLRDAHLEDCKLQNANLSGADLQNTHLEDERLDKVHNLDAISCTPEQMGALQARLGLNEGERRHRQRRPVVGVRSGVRNARGFGPRPDGWGG